MIRMPIFHENPRIQARMEKALAIRDFNEKNNILTTPLRTEKEFYDTVLEIYNKEIGDNNLYISNVTYDMDGALMLNEYAIKYKELNKNLSKFWEIRDILNYKEILSEYKKDIDTISIYIKQRDTDGKLIGYENIIGILVDYNDKYIKIKSNKNYEVLIIKYIDVELIDDEYDENDI